MADKDGRGGVARMTRVYAVLAAVVVAGFLGFMVQQTYFPLTDDPLSQCRGGQVAGGDIGGPFTMVDETGKTVTDRDVFTRPSLVYFGYTYCPDVCPLDAARNAEAVDILEEMGLDVQPVFITIDPARDTPEVLAEFTDALHPRMLGLTGTPEQVKAASDAYRTFFQVRDQQEEFYLMDHSTFTYLVMPETGFADFFRRETSAQEMADRVACFMGQG